MNELVRSLRAASIRSRTVVRVVLAVACLATLATSASGCRILSSDEEDPYFFDLTFDDRETPATGHAGIRSDTLVIRGEYLHASGSTRFVELVLPDFDGERTYGLGRAEGIYGAVDDGELERIGYSAGLPDDVVRIDRYDAGGGILAGAFFFYGTAYHGFEGTVVDSPFRVAGRFRMQLE